MGTLEYVIPAAIGERPRRLPASSMPLAHFAASAFGLARDGYNAQDILHEQADVMLGIVHVRKDRVVISPRIGEEVVVPSDADGYNDDLAQAAIATLHLPFSVDLEARSGHSPRIAYQFAMNPKTVTVNSLADYIGYRKDRMDYLLGAHRRAFDIMGLVGKIITLEEVIANSNVMADDYISRPELIKRLACHLTQNQIPACHRVIGLAGMRQTLAPEQGGAPVDFSGRFNFDKGFGYDVVSIASLSSLLESISAKRSREGLAKVIEESAAGHRR
jgi:hypothetical protein